MINWLQKIIFHFRAKRISRKKIVEAYLIQDSKYLQKAYKYSRLFLQRLAITYLGQLSTQENFDFLIEEMKVVTDIKLKSCIYAAIRNITLDKKIQISNNESEYLSQHLNVLKHSNYPTEAFLKTTVNPFSFTSEPKDALERLEDMKKSFDYGY